MSNTQNEKFMTKAQSTNALLISGGAEKGVDIEKILIIFKVTLHPADDDQYETAVIACKSKTRLMELIDDIPFDYNTDFCTRDKYTSIQFDSEFFIHPDQVIDGRKVDKIEEIGLYTYPYPDGIDTIIIESKFDGA